VSIKTLDAAVDVVAVIDGEERSGEREILEVIDPYRRTVSARVHAATADDVDDAVRGARQGAEEMARMPANRRAAILRTVAERVARDKAAFAERIVRDCGKCLRDANGELDRAVEILTLSAEESTRIAGDVIPLDGLPLGEGARIAFTLRQPVGVVAAIGPFNAPLSVIVHKIGPALAAGNAVVVKPALQGSAVTAMLARTFIDAGLPVRALQLVVGSGSRIGDQLVSHPGVDLVSFTGSGRVGEAIVRRAGLKRVIMELGGNAGVIIHEDADWEKAIAACIPAAYGIAGQSCVSLQRLYVHRSLFDRVAKRAAELSAALRVGDTLSPDTEIGVMIDEASARRVESWVQEAVSGGARMLTGGSRDGASLAPTVLVDVKSSMKVVCDEVFGPVVSLLPFDHIDDAIDAVNESPWGLASGVFTRSLAVAMTAARRLNTGMLNVNAPSRYRVEHVPYGGLKLSGWGKEGPRWSILEMTDQKTVIFTAP
jgi:acyl-CoA reductase-like NAD-dependent aldehyde dehydrogenase